MKQSTNNVSSSDEYSEVLSSIRHYSNMRFACLTLFSAITGGLFGAEFGNTVSGASDTQYWLSIWPRAGILASYVFLTLECCVTSFIVTFFAHARKINPTGHFTDTHFWARRISRTI